jgi:16S rRNA (cytosine1407-C5)-methyltransferase
MALPPAFVERLHAELGDAAACRIIASMSAPKRTAYWANPLRAGELPPFGAPIDGMAGVFAAAAEERELLVHHLAATRGRVYILNPSSVVAVDALQPQPGDEVLDLAAAPGGKTVLTAARMGNSGSILAVEPVKSRFFRLRANLDRCGVDNARCRLGDGRRVARALPPTYDRVLLDAPCASEARFRADDEATSRHCSPRKVRESVQKQRGLIRAAFRTLGPEGVLVYCTCSYSRHENEGVVSYLLRTEPGAELLPAEAPSAAMETMQGELPGTLRILPDELFDGFFIAKVGRRAR